MHILRFFRALWRYLRYTRIIRQIIEEYELILRLSVIFGSQFYTDWIDRIYAVINPAIKDGKYDSSSVLEYNSMGKPELSQDHIEAWIMGRMNLLGDLVKQNDLFDLFAYEIRKISENNDYLFIIEPLPFKDLKKNLGGAILETLLILIIVIVLIILF